MLTGLKVSSLAYNISVYFTNQNIMHSGDPIILNFEGLEIQNESKSMGRVQRVEEKNRVICLFIMFNPGVMVIKMSKTADFFDLLLMIAKKKKKNSQFGQNIYMHLKDHIEFFQNISWLIGFRVIVAEILRVGISKYCLDNKKIPKSCIFKG